MFHHSSHHPSRGAQAGPIDRPADLPEARHGAVHYAVTEWAVCACVDTLVRLLPVVLREIDDIEHWTGSRKKGKRRLKAMRDNGHVRTAGHGHTLRLSDRLPAGPRVPHRPSAREFDDAVAQEAAGEMPGQAS
ncbi:hypothetical protein [Streptomyces sp. BE230]|uniref:hypothetical protein n=1 Tax=Streptomyces sp. BE230 TaxID=3002526 RepID=UPI002ECFD479|nr:hypothetical protein [Streptomyces sp. BE230]